MAAKIARVVRADAVIDGDTTLDGEKITIGNIVEQHDHAEMRDTAVPQEEVIGDSPQEVTLNIGRSKVKLSPADMIVVIR